MCGDDHICSASYRTSAPNSATDVIIATTQLSHSIHNNNAHAGKGHSSEHQCLSRHIVSDYISVHSYVTARTPDDIYQDGTTVVALFELRAIVPDSSVYLHALLVAVTCTL